MVAAIHPLLRAQDMTVCMVADAASALRLQRAVQKSLTPEQQVYLKNRTLEDYQQLVMQGALHGVYLGAQLVSLVIFTQHQTESYKTDFNPTQQFGAALDNIYDFGILGGLMVHPGYRGLGLARQLVGVVVYNASALGLDRLFAETVAGNSFSINCFIRNGFDILGHEHYAPLGVDLCLLALLPTAAQQPLSASVA